MTKAELQSYRYIALEIERLEEEIERTRAKVESPAVQHLSHAPGGGRVPDRIADLVAEIEGLIENLEQQYKTMSARRERIDRAISVLHEREQRLIRLRYIDGKGWEQIAVDMNYSWRQVHNIHSEALKKIAHNCT